VTVNLQGHVFNGAGEAVSGATVDIFPVGTAADESTSSGSATASTTSDATGLWTSSSIAEGVYDVRIKSGTEVRWLRYEDRIQVDTIETATLKIRNPADTFEYNILPAAIADADRTLTLPLITTTDTLPAIGIAQTWSATQSYSANADIAFTGTTGTNDIVLTNALADALSVTDGSADILVIDTSTAGNVITFTSAVTVGVDGTGHDVYFYGDTASAYLLWDQSADKLLTAGNTFVDIVKDKLMIGGTAVTTTAAEINTLDGLDRGSILYGNASSATTVLGQGSADQVLTSDGTDISWEDAAGGAVLSGSTNNTVTTVTGSNAIIGEANLTFDGADLNIVNGNLIVADGHGIDFSAHGQATGMTAELLDDYEEGTHDVVATMGSGTCTIDPVYNKVHYTKVGRLVTVQGQIRVSAISSPSGTMTLSMPFSINTTQDEGTTIAGCVPRMYAAEIPTGGVYPFLTMVFNQGAEASLDWTRDDAVTIPHVPTTSDYYIFVLSYFA